MDTHLHVIIYGHQHYNEHTASVVLMKSSTLHIYVTRIFSHIDPLISVLWTLVNTENGHRHFSVSQGTKPQIVHSTSRTLVIYTLSLFLVTVMCLQLL